MHGTPLVLGSRIGSGGEGAVFELAGDEGRVAKIYHKPVSPEKSDKLRCMVDLACSDLTAFASWPVATVHDGRRGPVAGIVLPRVSNHDQIHTLYSPAHRKLKYPDKDWSFLVHVAMNCAAAFASIHEKSHLIADVNQGNVLVSPNGTVFLIDCDSFQVAADGRVFLCEVGVSHFTPPELQGINLRSVLRTENHDCFGLAVIIFHLLFLGRHPYAGRFLARGDMPLEQAIHEYRFAFSKSASSLQVAAPPNTLPMEAIAPSVACLFERAFTKGSERPGQRPTAKQWYAALKELRLKLRDCPADGGHMYSAAVPECPWCAIMHRKGPNFFSSVTVYRITMGAFEIGEEIPQLWRQIEAAPPLPTERASAMQAAQLPTLAGAPPSEAIEGSRIIVLTARWVTLAIALLTIAMLWSPAINEVSIPLCIVLVLIWGYLELGSGFGRERWRRRKACLARQKDLDEVNAEWASMVFHYTTEFEMAQMKLAGAHDRVYNLKARYDEEYQKLEKDKVNRQRNQLLRKSFLSEANIDNISDGWVAMLASYGIETAYDIDPSRAIEIAGLSRNQVESMRAWRRRVEAEFRFDESQGVPAADLSALAKKYLHMRRELEKTLRDGPATLQRLALKARKSLNDIDRRTTLAEIALAQAEADLAALR